MNNSENEPDLIDTKTLAKMLSVSVKWIEKHQHRIAGSIKIGRCRRFSLLEIRARIACGRDILIKR